MIKWEVVRQNKKQVLIVGINDATIEQWSIHCTDLEALKLMWKIHAEMGGDGTITRD